MKVCHVLAVYFRTSDKEMESDRDKIRSVRAVWTVLLLTSP